MPKISKYKKIKTHVDCRNKSGTSNGRRNGILPNYSEINWSKIEENKKTKRNSYIYTVQYFGEPLRKSSQFSKWETILHAQ